MHVVGIEVAHDRQRVVAAQRRKLVLAERHRHEVQDLAAALRVDAQAVQDRAAVGDEHVPLAHGLRHGAAVARHPQPQVVDPVPVEVRGDGPFADPDEHVRHIDVELDVGRPVERTPAAEIQRERIVRPGTQVVEPVAVEVADDRIADHVHAGQLLVVFDRQAVVLVHVPDAARFQCHFVAVGVIIIEVAGDRQSVDGHRVGTNQVRHAVVIGVDQPAEIPAHLAVGGQLGEAVGPRVVLGGQRIVGQGGEVARQDLVAGEAQHVGDVLVDRVLALRVPGEVAVGIDVDAAGGEDANFSTGIDREAGHEVAAGQAIARGPLDVLLRLDGVRFAVQPVARMVGQLVPHGQRKAVVGQRVGELEHDPAGGHVSAGDDVRVEPRVGDRNQPVEVAADFEVARLQGRTSGGQRSRTIAIDQSARGMVDDVQRRLQGRVQERGRQARHADRQVLDVDRQAVDQRGRAVFGWLRVEQVVLRFVARRGRIVRDVDAVGAAGAVRIVDPRALRVEEDVQPLSAGQVAEDVAGQVLGVDHDPPQAVLGEAQRRVVQVHHHGQLPLAVGLVARRVAELVGAVVRQGHGLAQEHVQVVHAVVRRQVGVQPHDRVGLGQAPQPRRGVAGDAVAERFLLQGIPGIAFGMQAVRRDRLQPEEHRRRDRVDDDLQRRAAGPETGLLRAGRVDHLDPGRQEVAAVGQGRRGERVQALLQLRGEAQRDLHQGGAGAGGRIGHALVEDRNAVPGGAGTRLERDRDHLIRRRAVAELPGRSCRKEPSSRRKIRVGVLSYVVLSNCDRPVSLLAVWPGGFGVPLAGRSSNSRS